MKPIVVQITIDATEDGAKACDLLSTASGLSKSQVKRAMNQGAAWLQQPHRKSRRLRRAAFRLSPGDRLTLCYDEAISTCRAPTASCQADCNRYSIWFKPSGLMTQGTRFGDHCSLQYQIERYFQPPRKAYMVHRLDREAAGLIIVAHDNRSAGLFSGMLQRREIEKRYRIEVRGNLALRGAVGSIDIPLDGKSALTHYETISYDDKMDVSTADVRIVTGRLHQIRRHFERIGFPVMGDPRYGASNKNKQGMRLVATELSFVCPFSKNAMVFQAETDLRGDDGRNST
jgi:tRNA pseudouridine32 synthase/23S rRNA pseudouridine746 synthase